MNQLNSIAVPVPYFLAAVIIKPNYCRLLLHLTKQNKTKKKLKAYLEI